MNFFLPKFNFESNFSLTLLFLLLVIWSFIWKGLALWHAAKEEERNWFVAILVLNTIGVLEILYLFIFAKDKLELSSLLKKIKPRKY